jgi:hypothetical protein
MGCAARAGGALSVSTKQAMASLARRPASIGQRAGQVVGARNSIMGWPRS